MLHITSINDLEVYQGCMITFTINHEYTNSLFTLQGYPNIYYGVLLHAKSLQTSDHTYLLVVTFCRNGHWTPPIELNNEFYDLKLRASTLDEINAIKNNRIDGHVDIYYPGIDFDYLIEANKKFEDV